MSVTYSYTISTGTANGIVNSGSLLTEVHDSTILIAISSISTSSDTLEIEFKGAISSSEKTELDAVVLAHEGLGTSEPDLVSVQELQLGTAPRVEVQKPEGDFNTYLTHNFCDDATWPSTSDSNWVFQPDAGKVLAVDWAELQFTHDINMTGKKVLFDYYAWIGGGASMMVQRIEFDTIYSIFELGNTHSTCPAIGTEMPHSLTTVHFNYVKKILLYGSDTPGSLFKLEVSIDTDTELTGTFLKGSFVASESDI